MKTFLLQTLLVLVIPILISGCLAEAVEDAFNDLEKPATIVTVNGTLEEVVIQVDTENYSIKPHEYISTEVRYKDDYKVVYNNSKQINLVQQKTHVYYATTCSEDGHIEHEVRTHNVNIINLSDLDLSKEINTLKLTHGNIDSIIEGDFSACSTLPQTVKTTNLKSLFHL